MDFEKGQLRALHRRSDLKGTAIFLLDLFLFAVFILLCIRSTSLLLKANYTILAGVMTSLLFVVGHDACHQSLTSRRWLNRLLGTVAFLPCLHAFSFWDLGHNRIHHGFTNRRGKDYVWEPLTYPEFVALSGFQRLKYRFFRTAVGHYWYYLCEILVEEDVLPSSLDCGELHNRERDRSRGALDMDALMAVHRHGPHVAHFRPDCRSLRAGNIGAPLLRRSVLDLQSTNVLGHLFTPHGPPSRLGVRRCPSRCPSASAPVVGPRRVSVLHKSGLPPHHGAHRSPRATGHSVVQPGRGANPPRATLLGDYRSQVEPAFSPGHPARCKLFDLDRRCWTGYDGVATGPRVISDYLTGEQTASQSKPKILNDIPRQRRSLAPGVAAFWSKCRSNFQKE